MSEYEQQKKVFEQFFREADVNNDNSVSIVELRNILSAKSKEQVTDDTLKGMCLSIDADGDCKISLQEFLDSMLKKPRKQAFEETFHQMDTENTGKLRRDQIAVFCQKSGGISSENEIQRMFDEVDVNGDGVISFDEFMKLV